MLHQDFVARGFMMIPSNHYVDQNNYASLHDVKKIFDVELENDGSIRKRAYLKLHWNRESEKIHIPDDQSYYQSAIRNKDDGGKIRQFKVMDRMILCIPLIRNLIMKNLEIIKHYPPLQSHTHLVMGMHFIRYESKQFCASYSSPDWLHKDDEPLVFIHLIHLSRNAIGGDNLIANESTEKVTHVIRLENELETLVLNQQVYHAVTPLGCREGTAMRDVILFTVEPMHTQAPSVRS